MNFLLLINIDLYNSSIYATRNQKSDQEAVIPDRSAIVTFKGQRAGVLRELGRDTHFAYDEGWTLDIACALPAERREHVYRDGLIPFFEHLGPEGWLRGVQARAGGVSSQDDFGILLRYGADCIGAVGLLPLEDAIPLEPSGPLSAEAAAATGQRTLSGVQRKLLVWKDGSRIRPVTRPEDPSTYIAKFNAAQELTLVQNEALSLRLAREVLGEQAITRSETCLVEEVEEVALVVERFDRDGDNRLRLEDFAQILGKPRGRDFGGKYESSYEEAAAVIQTHSARPRIDLDRYFRLVLFNFVIGNADAHLKNFSLLESSEGLRLSPAYDLLNTLLYPFSRETALAVGGRKRPIEELDRPTLETFGAEIGLSRAAIKNAFGALAKAFANPTALRIGAAVQPDQLKARYADIVHANAGRILA